MSVTSVCFILWTALSDSSASLAYCFCLCPPIVCPCLLRLRLLSASTPSPLLVSLISTVSPEVNAARRVELLMYLSAGTSLVKNFELGLNLGKISKHAANVSTRNVRICKCRTQSCGSTHMQFKQASFIPSNYFPDGGSELCTPLHSHSMVLYLGISAYVEFWYRCMSSLLHMCLFHSLSLNCFYSPPGSGSRQIIHNSAQSTYKSSSYSNS